MASDEIVGNVDHRELQDGEASDSIQEIAEYIIQYRENDLVKLTPKTKFKINVDEHSLFSIILVKEKHDFRGVVRKALIKAFSYYRFDRNRTDLFGKAKEVYGDIEINIRVPKTIDIGKIRAEKHENQIITFPCEILMVTEPETITTRLLYKCNSCGDEQTHAPRSGRHVCVACHEDMIEDGVAESETVQTVTLKDINSADNNPTIFTADLHRELAGNAEMNKKVMVTGVFKSIPPTSRHKNKNEILIDVINLDTLEEDKTIKPDPLTLQMYKDLAKSGKLIDKLIDSYAWHIEGHRDEKLASMLYLTGGVTEKNYRGRIHVFYLGDPATGKTEIAKWMLRVTPNSGITDGTGSSGVGLGAGMVKLPNGTNGMVSGPLVRHNKGFVVIDELDKMEKDQYEMLLGIMEDGRCRRTLAGVDIDLPAYTSILACANPVGGKWDMDDQSIGANINLSAPLLSRADVMFRFLQVADAESDLRISRHIQKSRQGTPKGIFSEEELTAFFNYVRELRPNLPPESEEFIIQFYIQREKFALSKDSISMDQRQYGALIRLSYAFAKLLFKHTVDEECVNLAIGIYKRSVASFGIALEAGGSTAEASPWFVTDKDSKDKAFKKIFNQLEDKNHHVFREELVYAMSQIKQWKSEGDAHSYLNVAHSKGHITENNGEIKLVD